MQPLSELIDNFTGSHGSEDILTAEFKRFAVKFFYGGYFAVGDTKVYLRDIEFYYNDDEEVENRVVDAKMYHTSGEHFIPGSLNYHSSGVDFTFESKTNHFRASILLRGIRVVDSHGRSIIEDRPLYIPGYFLQGQSTLGAGYTIRWVDTDIDEEEYAKREIRTTTRKNIPGERLWRYIKPVLLDKETDSVHFSSYLASDYKKQYADIEAKLKKHGANPVLLNHTNDIWARDYMPIQIDENYFIKYKYDPDYLNNGRDEEFKTDCAEACQELGITYTETDIVLDGGNMIKTQHAIIMTDKIYKENGCNTSDERKQLRDRLIKLFGTKVLIIPQDPEDELGHSDGMVRYLGENKVLLTNYEEWGLTGCKAFYKRVKKALESGGFQVVSYSLANVKGENIPSDLSVTWIYTNFLQTKQCILLPSTGVCALDNAAKTQLEGFLPDYKDKVELVDIMAISEDKSNGGGAMNCVSWNIKKL